MNSEERQRLNTNELGQTIQVVGHRLEEHATKIVAGICAILLIAAAVTWFSRQTNSSSVKAWTLLESAENVNDFGEVAEDFKGTPAGRWARLRESELNMQSGMGKMFEDREVANLDLKKAKEGFEGLANDKGADVAIQERALWGLALVTEATCDGETSKALEAYERLLKEFPDTFYKSVAEQRVASLKTAGAKEFYAWFSKQNPKPADIRPKDGAKGDLDSMLPPPAAPFDLRPNPPKDGETALEKDPGTDAAAPEKPATDPKSDAKPQESAKPATDTEKKE